MKNQKGFTLIELLIVLVILGIMALAIIPNLPRFLGYDKPKFENYTVTEKLQFESYSEFASDIYPSIDEYPGMRDVNIIINPDHTCDVEVVYYPPTNAIGEGILDYVKFYLQK